MSKTLRIKDVMDICDCSHQAVINWIKKGYLPATPLNPGKYRSVFTVEEADLKTFMKSDHYAGHPEDIRKSRPFNRTPEFEKCYPINLLASVLNIDFDKDEEPTDIWNYDIRRFKQLICLLNDREQRVIQMRYQYGMTLDEVGAAFDCARERIRQIQLKAERKLRTWLSTKGCMVVTREVYNELKDKYAGLLTEYEKLRVQYDKITSDEAIMAAANPKADISLIKLEEMDMTVRSYNCLKRAGINTLQDIIEFDMNQQNPPSNHNWLTIRNLGKKSLMEVAKKVFDYCNYRIQYFSDNKYQGYIPILEGESLVIGNVEYFGGENHERRLLREDERTGEDVIESFSVHDPEVTEASKDDELTKRVKLQKNSVYGKTGRE